MAELIDIIKGDIVDYNEKTHELTIVAKYNDYPALLRRQYKTVEIRLNDSRPLSDKQRRMCYALIGEIAEWCGDAPEAFKEVLKLDFIHSELLDMMDSFSLANASRSIVAGFQRWLARFVVRNDIPTKKPMLVYVDDIDDYVYACLINKKCAICGKRADLHHVDRIGMGSNRTDVIHEGLEVLPLCRDHHNEAHGMPDKEFFTRYHLNGGIKADKTICKIYKLKRGKRNGT